ncbi:MAG: glycosyltransferase family 4 protein [Syntrophobacterales bacterium]|nr:glycosyltransferase family 4 protein [Syntrophobacterales bacterium]
MNRTSPRLGMVLKGFPRISETFISNEILAMEKMGLNIGIFSLRKPREPFAHKSVAKIKASVAYLPEYILPFWKILLKSNTRLFLSNPLRYLIPFLSALRRSFITSSPLVPTIRHFLQGGYLARNYLIDHSIHHLHAHFAHTPTSVALFASELARIPFSFTAHAKDIYTSHPVKLRYKISKAQFVITCTEYNRKYLIKIANGSPTPIYRIYHGIDLSLFSFGREPLPSPPFRILSVGRLVKKKGYDDLLKALKILKSENFPFEFFHVGDGELRENILRMAEELGLTDRVHFLGTLTHERLLPLYRQSHAFVLASKIAPNGDRDGLPNVILEAMAVGLPVVATDVSAIPEAIEHEKTGLLVPPENPHEMAKAIRRILTDSSGTSAIISEARRTVERRFDSTVWNSKLYEIFHEALVGKALKHESSLRLSEQTP